MNKVISELMIQNTSYLHRINESVVNRLLNIIETNQQVMANSRCSHANTYEPNSRTNFHSICTGHRSLRNSVKKMKNEKGEATSQKDSNSRKGELEDQ
jgi:hypothetical protein